MALPEHFGFGLVEPREEGGRLWPNDFLYFNGRFPSEDFYTLEEKAKFRKMGYPPEAYGD